LARSIPITPTRDGIKSGCSGVVAAQRHPTGWFIFAGVDPDSTAEQIEDFAHFVVVRTYLLLEYGPQPSTWANDEAGAWCADCPTSMAGAESLPLIG
jgi:hypothetical protein